MDWQINDWQINDCHGILMDWIINHMKNKREDISCYNN